MYEIKHKLTGQIIFSCEDANFKGANLEYADFECANFEGAYFEDANFEGANLKDAKFEGAYFEGAKNILSFQAGEHSRICIAVKHETEVKFKIGCYWGSMQGAILRIRKKYGRNSNYEKLVSIYNDMLKN